ncbi:hypothetical protein TTRE_0000967601 [Trichuris trichiura]|uniref:C2H2-type domain-containing protein n=1 Tax=Trichuris trichiura TaxID=36087 RepID=A0A077ZLN8_TRITR|nr:hypothetical protein TTRE_0000967601 [Trichuris trichiura]
MSPLLMLCLSNTPNNLTTNTTNKSFEPTRPASSGSSHSSYATSVGTSNDGSNLNNPASSQSARHNDVSFYPYIQCVMCDQWICSRNRFTHIEFHLQYRPYKCSLCEYDNRKEIFIQIHLRKYHKGENGESLFLPSEDIEKRVWELADQSLQKTSRVIRAEPVQSGVTSNAQMNMATILTASKMVTWHRRLRRHLTKRNRKENVAILGRMVALVVPRI